MNELKPCPLFGEKTPSRESGCEFCDFSSGGVSGTINNKGDDFLLVQSDDDVCIATDDNHFRLLKIDFCPMCGKRLTTKDDGQNG